tara:strand:+ start:326 stop:541 length:216 start_codon:yes stop_codon:yes gene_type:complete
MRTIPKILNYDEILSSFHAPKGVHAHRINKHTGTKVHVIRDLQCRVKNSKKRHKFGVVQDKMRDMLLDAGL